MTSGEFKPPTKDPWVGLRGVMAGVLVLEAIVVLLGLPVVAHLSGGIGWISGTYLTVVAVLMVVAAGLQRRSWALPMNLALQGAFVLGWLAHPSIGAIGIVFCGVWAYILRLRSDVADRLKQGLLPGQRD